MCAPKCVFKVISIISIHPSEEAECAHDYSTIT